MTTKYKVTGVSREGRRFRFLYNNAVDVSNKLIEIGVNHWSGSIWKWTGEGWKLITRGAW